ncbi:nucleoside deaminase [Hyphomicrobium sp.]|uniref:nucleoside deaminase n=1 Tax=Hyphomicrobium sp. TaxID=82 RepID=UPI0025B88379|nr:nucleoside deaminase [Hyphomicrobium sp.]MCC7253670.1 nucleoside deaminase [Hyphomicrobium sp.]
MRIRPASSTSPAHAKSRAARARALSKTGSGLPAPPKWLATFKRPALADDADAVALALRLAERNIQEETGGPFGAVVYSLARLEIVGVGVNVVESSGLSVMHAEIAALIDAQTREGGYDALANGFGLACSCQPCTMCLGAIHWARLQRLSYSATKADAEKIGFDEGPGDRAIVAGLRRRGVRVICGLHRERGRQVFEDYRRREGKIY